jgi:hypothetical protein
MTLRYVTLGHDGKAAREELVLDGRVCECCQTSAALTREGPVVVYRDRSEDELRDIAIVRLLPDGKWSAPRAVHADGWRLEGCPINGPAVAASGRRVGVAWFTMGGDNVARVRVAFSNDAGATFGDPVNVDDGDPVGRVDVLMLDDGGALVSWIEKTRDGAEVRARRIWPGGRRGASISVAPSGSARSSGFPQMVRSKNTIIFSWTGASRVLTAEMSVPVR